MKVSPGKILQSSMDNDSHVVQQVTSGRLKGIHFSILSDEDAVSAHKFSRVGLLFCSKMLVETCSLNISFAFVGKDIDNCHRNS